MRAGAPRAQHDFRLIEAHVGSSAPQSAQAVAGGAAHRAERRVDEVDRRAPLHVRAEQPRRVVLDHRRPQRHLLLRQRLEQNRPLR